MANQVQVVADVEAVSEATIRLTIQNFSKLDDDATSPPVDIKNLTLTISAGPRYDEIGQSNEQEKYLGFFLKCNSRSESLNWLCNVRAVLRIIPQKEGCQPKHKQFKVILDAEHESRGYRKFESFTEIMNPENGFIKDDSIMLEAQVSVNAPHGTNWPCILVKLSEKIKALEEASTTQKEDYELSLEIQEEMRLKMIDTEAKLDKLARVLKSSARHLLGDMLI